MSGVEFDQVYLSFLYRDDGGNLYHSVPYDHDWVLTLSKEEDGDH